MKNTSHQFNGYDLEHEVVKSFMSFTDLYILVDDIKNSYLYYPNQDGSVPLNQSFKSVYSKLIKKIYDSFKVAKGKNDILVIFENRHLRCCRMKTINGTVIAVRQMPLNYIDLYKLGLGNIVTKELMHNRLNSGGLIIICGAPGNGKTTTSSATVTKRLEEHSGMCITIEDPPELPLDGKHGEGICIQTTVSPKGFHDSIKTSMRAYPTGQHSIMFVGEVRDQKTAVEVLKASIDGRLVITTLHTDSVLSAVQRLASLASKEVGDHAYDILSNSFRVAVHQKLKRNRTRLSVNIECMVNTISCTNLIKNKKILMLKNELEKQSKIWKNGRKVEYF